MINLIKEKDKCNKIKESLLERIYGQNHAVITVVNSYFDMNVMKEEKVKKPLLTFLFAGPPGVGKTYLAEEFANELGMKYMRFDMSGYSEYTGLNNLIGIHKSYKDAGPGQLTKFVLENPTSILLFDEIEKAHEQVINLFLQVLNDGVLTDNFTEQKVFFDKTIIIFTSNVGKNIYNNEDMRNMNMGLLSQKEIIEALVADTNTSGRPFLSAPLLSRLSTGQIIMFNNLLAKDLRKVILNQLNKSKDLLKNNTGIEVNIDRILATILLLQFTRNIDARAIRGQTQQYFNNTIRQVIDLDKKSNIKKIHLDVDFDSRRLDRDIYELFKPSHFGDILFISNNNIIDYISSYKKLNILKASSNEEVLSILENKQVLAIFIDIRFLSTETDEFGDQIDSLMYRKMTTLIKQILSFFPEQFIYILEENISDKPFVLSDVLLSQYLEIGVTDTFYFDNKYSVKTQKNFFDCLYELYLQKIVDNLSNKRLVLKFKSLISNGENTEILINDFVLEQSISALDKEAVLESNEKQLVSLDKDVIGCDTAKRELKFFIEYLKDPKKFAGSQLKAPKGILLYGPPGTGKTLLARAVASEADVAFFPVDASKFGNTFVNSMSMDVKKLFAQARKYAPSIIFIDEIDAIGKTRKGGYNVEDEKALNTLLTELDGFGEKKKRAVFVMAATNFPIKSEKGGVSLDPALVRRFDRLIEVELPNIEARKSFILMQLNKIKNNKVSSGAIATLTNNSVGMSLANLSNVINLAIRNVFYNNQEFLTDEIILDSLDEIQYGDKKLTTIDKRIRTAWHEAGHALLYYINGTVPSFITIIPRGSHGGYMHLEVTDEVSAQTKKELFQTVEVSLAGRCAEIYKFGIDEVSNGANNDLEHANYIVDLMIKKWGMDSKDFGLNHYNIDNLETQIRINDILTLKSQDVLDVIKNNVSIIEKLVDALLVNEFLYKEQIVNILNQLNK